MTESDTGTKKINIKKIERRNENVKWKRCKPIKRSY